MYLGTVKEFSDKKYFGFIEQDDGSDIFFHGSDIEPKWRGKIGAGDRVQFDILTDIKGLKAIKVRKI